MKTSILNWLPIAAAIGSIAFTGTQFWLHWHRICRKYRSVVNKAPVINLSGTESADFAVFDWKEYLPLLGCGSLLVAGMVVALLLDSGPALLALAGAGMILSSGVTIAIFSDTARNSIEGYGFGLIAGCVFHSAVVLSGLALTGYNIFKMFH